MKFYLDFSVNSLFSIFGYYNRYFILLVENDLGYYSFVQRQLHLIGLSNKFLIYFFRNRSFISFLRNLESSLNFNSFGYYLELAMIGLGFKITRYRRSSLLEFELQYSHKVFYKIPNDVIIKTSKKYILIFGLNKAVVFDVAIKLKNLRFPNIYTGTGIRFKGENIKLKPGKQR